MEIDCPPGAPRPGYFIEGVLEGIADATVYAEPVRRLYGEWAWKFNLETTSWPTQEKTIMKRLAVLYDAGAIRYWSVAVDD